jgi:hypothetical protein
MAKTTKTSNLFSGFNPPTLPSTSTVEKKEVPEVVAEKKVMVEEKKEVVKQNISTQQFIFKRGRPKELVGKQHLYSARINEDLFKLAKKTAEKKFDNSVNAYLNYLIAKDQGLM